jgi:hypothetical protein
MLTVSWGESSGLWWLRRFWRGGHSRGHHAGCQVIQVFILSVCELIAEFNAENCYSKIVAFLRERCHET